MRRGGVVVSGNLRSRSASVFKSKNAFRMLFSLVLLLLCRIYLVIFLNMQKLPLQC
jgi:hypothetical protein